VSGQAGDWVAETAVAQILATVFSGIGLFVSGIGLFVAAHQTRAARKSSDFETLITLESAIREREGVLLAGDSDAKKSQAFVEFLNFLETVAAALNGKLLQKTTRTLAEDKLCSSIAAIQNSPAWYGELQRAITSSTTFMELAKFISRHRSAIDAHVTQLRP
jgi:hypothetical protein